MSMLKNINGSHLRDIWGKVSRERPLIYHITNTVAASLQANTTLAIGASPLMSQYPGESSDLASISSGLLVNLGTPTPAGIGAANSALTTANKKKKITLLDPVGYGASSIRTNITHDLLEKYDFSIIKGNAGEMSLMAGLGGKTRGVDVALAKDTPLAVAKVALAYGCVACATGETDFISDGESIFEIMGGDKLLPRVSGSGCALGSIMIACAAASSDPIGGSLTGLVAMGIASERADKKGAGSFVPSLLDNLSTLSPDDFKDSRSRWRVIE